jgi:glycogen debranching enzyme
MYAHVLARLGVIVLKEGRTYLALDPAGDAWAWPQGVYRDDTRMLSRWCWKVGPAQVLSVQTRGEVLEQHTAIVDEKRYQHVGLERRLIVNDAGFTDGWTLTNTGRERRTVELSLEVEGEFRDLFAVWGDSTADGDRTVHSEETADTLGLARVALDGVRPTADIRFETDGARSEAAPRNWTFDLEPGARGRVTAHVALSNGVDDVKARPLPDYAEWRASFDLQHEQIDRRRSISRAVDDLRMLLLPTAHGAYPAAGLPWFSCVFGRDALITAQMLLPWRPELAASVLDHLASEQGKVVDPFREEEPGKILHEMRRGELSRSGRIPFGRYFGSVDATALFIVAMGDYVTATGDMDRVSASRAAWEGAVTWLEAHRAETGDLVAFKPSGSGLTIQSWKDSADSMNHADGREAEAPLAVAEVQGYTFAAFQAAAGFYRHLGEDERAAECETRARRLADELHARFWLEDLGTYAMALDRHGQPLRVLSSDPGHLLWSGVVPAHAAPRLVETLMGPELWSGWGLRTLGRSEVRFNPVSYHNGSVWPHDTALFAGGLARYGFSEEARTVAEAMFDLAAHWPLNRLPELISGFDRQEDLGPIPYTHACQPQAWAAAGLLYAARVSGLA